MVTTNANNVMEEIAHNLGYRSVFDFTRIQIQTLLLQKIAYYQSRIDIYEQKYSMNFEEFRRRVVDKNDSGLSKFGIIEKEDDDNNWGDAVDFVKIYFQKLQILLP